MELLDYLRRAVKDQASDLFLVAGGPVCEKLDNRLVPVSEGRVFPHAASIHLETEEELPWSLDGEYAPSAPAVDIENHRQALTMLL